MSSITPPEKNLEIEERITARLRAGKALTRDEALYLIFHAIPETAAISLTDEDVKFIMAHGWDKAASHWLAEKSPKHRRWTRDSINAAVRKRKQGS